MTANVVKPLAYIVGILLFGFLILPLLIVLPMSVSSASALDFPPPDLSLQHFRSFFEDAQWTDAGIRSLKVAGWSSLVATALGTMAAYGIRGRGSYVRGPLQAFMLLPLITPTIVIAAAANLVLARLGLINSELGLVLIHSALGVPLTFLIVRAAFSRFDPSLERASMSLGASRITTFAKVTGPILTPNLLVAGFFAFIVSFDEVVVASFIAGRGATTLPKKMWDSIFLEIDPVLPVVATLMIGLTLLMGSIAWGVRRLYRARNVRTESTELPRNTA